VQLNIESNDASERFDLEDGFRQVIDHLEFPNHIRLLCFLDNQNEAKLVASVGGSNRGFHLTLKEYYAELPQFRFISLPDRVEKLITFNDADEPNFDNLVYLHGSTTKYRPAFIMSLAHELQHVLQYANHFELWRDNTIMEKERTKFGAAFANTPIEREAMIVSRRVATRICGRQDVERYIQYQNSIAQAELIRWNLQNDWNADFLGLQEESEAEIKNHCVQFPKSSIKS
jgi:hypothetical protein